MSSIEVTQTIKLTIRGVPVELSKDEATELRDALAALLGDPKQDDRYEAIRKKIDQIRDKSVDRIPFPIIPTTPPRTLPWPPPRDDSGKWPYQYREIWCSADANLRMAIGP